MEDSAQSAAAPEQGSRAEVRGLLAAAADGGGGDDDDEAPLWDEHSRAAHEWSDVPPRLLAIGSALLLLGLVCAVAVPRLTQHSPTFAGGGGRLPEHPAHSLSRLGTASREVEHLRGRRQAKMASALGRRGKGGRRGRGKGGRGGRSGRSGRTSGPTAAATTAAAAAAAVAARPPPPPPPPALSPPPPAASPTLLVVPQGGSLSIECAAGTFVEKVAFASWGTPRVHHANRSAAIDPSCHSRRSLPTVVSACEGQSHCCLPVSEDNFRDDPCKGVIKTLAVVVEGCAVHAAPTRYRRHCSLLGQHLLCDEARRICNHLCNHISSWNPIWNHTCSHIGNHISSHTWNHICNHICNHL